jgi:hypothetical protein
MSRQSARLVSAVIIGLFAVATAAYADSSRQLTIGVFGGASLSTIRGDDLSGSLSSINLGPLDDSDEFDIFDPTITDPLGIVVINDVTLDPVKSRTGFTLGAFLNVPISEVFSIQPEMHYVARGAKQNLEFDTTVDPGGLDIPLAVPGGLEWQFNYIEIPVLAKITMPVQGSISPSFIAGPALALRTSSKVEAEALGVSESADIKDIIKSTDVGLVFGGCLDVRMSPTTVLNFDARYNLGMSDLLDVPPILSLFTPSMKNGGFGFRVAIGYRLGRN